MTSFAEILATLPSIDHLSGLKLYQNDTLVDTIPNQPGKSGSLAVYYALYQQFGQLNPAAAEAGLTLFAEHGADARAHPGKHPNIDRLLQIIAEGSTLELRPLARTGESE